MATGLGIVDPSPAAGAAAVNEAEPRRVVASVRVFLRSGGDYWEMQDVRAHASSSGAGLYDVRFLIPLDMTFTGAVSVLLMADEAFADAVPLFLKAPLTAEIGNVRN
jgi:hypothetical protein